MITGKYISGQTNIDIMYCIDSTLAINITETYDLLISLHFFVKSFELIKINLYIIMK